MKKLIVVFVLVVSAFGYGQIDVVSAEGVQLDVQTSTLLNGLANPSEGLLVGNTTTKSLWYYNGTEFIDLMAIAAGGLTDAQVSTAFLNVNPNTDLNGTEDFLVDGTRAMTGDIAMAKNKITGLNELSFLSPDNAKTVKVSILDSAFYLYNHIGGYGGVYNFANGQLNLGAAIYTLGGLATGAGDEMLVIDVNGNLSSQAIPSGDAFTTNPLSQFVTTTSDELASVISNETGSGSVVFQNAPTLYAPNVGALGIFNYQRFKIPNQTTHWDIGAGPLYQPLGYVDGDFAITYDDNPGSGAEHATIFKKDGSIDIKGKSIRNDAGVLQFQNASDVWTDFGTGGGTATGQTKSYVTATSKTFAISDFLEAGSLTGRGKYHSATTGNIRDTLPTGLGQTGRLVSATLALNGADTLFVHRGESAVWHHKDSIAPIIRDGFYITRRNEVVVDLHPDGSYKFFTDEISYFTNPDLAVAIYDGQNAADPVNEVNGTANITSVGGAGANATITSVITNVTSGSYAVRVANNAGGGRSYVALQNVAIGDQIRVTFSSASVVVSGSNYYWLNPADGWLNADAENVNYQLITGTGTTQTIVLTNEATVVNPRMTVDLGSSVTVDFDNILVEKLN